MRLLLAVAWGSVSSHICLSGTAVVIRLACPTWCMMSENKVIPIAALPEFSKHFRSDRIQEGVRANPLFGRLK